MIKSREELKNWYKELKSKYQGYIQMSDSRINKNHIFVNEKELPKWDELHNGINYILEMALFDPNSKQSILVRQHNDSFLVIDKILEDEKIEKVSYHTVTSNTPKAIIAQIWEPKPNEFCNNWNVNELTMLLFAGFEKTEEKQGGKNDKSTI